MALSYGIMLMIAGLAGCAVNHVGAATPQNASHPGTPAIIAPGVSRPRDIKIDSVPPCELFTPGNRQEFKNDRPFREEKHRFFKYPVCDFHSRAEKVTVAIDMVVDRDMSAFAPGKVAGHARLVQVLGFPAYEGYSDAKPGNLGCSVDIGVVQGQVLSIQVLEQGRYENPLTQEEVCRRAMRGAELALGNLLARG
ncbi:Protein of unknown function [Allokutzneria albata]|uniref:DUF3558 domain-containing protein n=2 Tax=Allokutzneria albata TaxID=211114 RepID=A0A1G9XF10_ALLAB|nr:Protein of unknown function [Allokutzneria albata]